MLFSALNLIQRLRDVLIPLHLAHLLRMMLLILHHMILHHLVLHQTDRHPLHHLVLLLLLLHVSHMSLLLLHMCHQLHHPPILLLLLHMCHQLHHPPILLLLLHMILVERYIKLYFHHCYLTWVLIYPLPLVAEALMPLALVVDLASSGT
jgi:hypothetical protein